MKKDRGNLLGQKFRTGVAIAISLVVLLGIAYVVLHSAMINEAEVEKQMDQNLEDVARQNAAILETKIDARYQLLLSLSEELKDADESEIQSLLDRYEIFLDKFHLKRFAISLPGGTTYSTDGEVTDLSYREFYKRGMNGESYITGILYDALSDEHEPVNVMTIPIYSSTGELSGVFGLTYETKEFNRSLGITSFDGKGGSFIFNEDGEIMSVGGIEGLELSGNIFDELSSEGEKNEEVIRTLRACVEDKTESSGMVYLSDAYHYCMIPIELLEGDVAWYLMTTLPAGEVNERVSVIRENQYQMSLVIVLLVTIGAVLMMMYQGRQYRQGLKYAYEDSLTKGPNYAGFCMELEQKRGHKGCLIAMDIANFTNISIVAGEDAGNRMIEEVWGDISGILHKEEQACHVRDDVFLLYLQEQEKEEIIRRMEALSSKIQERAKQYEVHGIHICYGICRLDEKDTVGHAYGKVKMAREFAKNRKDVHYAFYSEVDRKKIQQERMLEDRFPTAIAQEEFEVWYQPKYGANDSHVVGSEALVRWRDENGQMVSPGAFIPLFESNGMIATLDEYVFRNVCRQQRKWMDEGKVVYPVSINISRASLYCLDVHERYWNILQEYQVPPEYIQLEVTETIMKDGKDIRLLLNRFRDMGIKILMDDFGTGYSSLATLSLQCFDTLKLDKTLIDHIGNQEGEIMLYHIIKMGQQMGFHITAEGVEERSQLEFLQDMRCDDIQGFYFSRPIPGREYEDILDKE